MLELAVGGNDALTNSKGMETIRPMMMLVMMLMATVKVITIVIIIRYYDDIVITIINIITLRTAVASTVWLRQ